MRSVDLAQLRIENNGERVESRNGAAGDRAADADAIADGVVGAAYTVFARRSKSVAGYKGGSSVERAKRMVSADPKPLWSGNSHSFANNSLSP